MVDTVNELAGLSRRLNQSSDKINSIIADLNKKLVALNFGIEVWTYGPIAETDPELLDPSKLASNLRSKNVDYLGWCKLSDVWQLSVKSGTLVESVDEGGFSELTDVDYMPLSKTSREMRAAAIKAIPELLDRIKIEAEALLDSIEKAEAAAAKL
jgi:hypothetical protein